MRKIDKSGISARALRSRLPATRRDRAYLVPLALFSISYAAYLATFALAIWPDWPLFINLAAAAANGGVIGLLFIIGHDACHGSYTPSAALNRCLARLAFLPALQPYTSWVHTHNGLHHGWTNLKGKDVVFAPFTVTEYAELPRWRRWVERGFRTLWGVGLMHLAMVWWRFELFPPATHAPKNRAAFQSDRLLVLGFLVLKCGLAVTLAHRASGDFLSAVVRAGLCLGVIYWVWFWLIGLVTFTQHTHPEVPWYDRPDEWSFYRGQIHGSPHLRLPWWLHKLLYNVMDHAAHHVDPLIPLYRLPSTQRQLRRQHQTDLVTATWTFGASLRAFRVCRLYDYARHQWLDFDGTPTSRAGLNVLPESVRTGQAA